MKSVLFFVANWYEDLELWYPKIRLEEEGMSTVVAGLGEKTYQGKRGYPITVDTSVDEVEARDFDEPDAAGRERGADAEQEVVHVWDVLHDLPRREAVIRPLGHGSLLAHVSGVDFEPASERRLAEPLGRLVAADFGSGVFQMLEIIPIATADFHDALSAQPKATHEVLRLSGLILLHLRRVAHGHQVVLVKILSELRLDLHEAAFATVENF